MLLSFQLLLNCSKTETEYRDYIFVQSYCITITVGGFVGIKEQCYKVGDAVTAESISANSITIRIANGPQVNIEPGPWSFQELLEIPMKFVNKK